MKQIFLFLLFLSFIADIVYGIQCITCQICPGSSVNSSFIQKEITAEGCSFCRVSYLICSKEIFLFHF